MADEPKNEPSATDDPKPDNEPKDDPAPEPKSDYPEDLGDAGKKALDAERQARRDAEAKIKELEPLAAKAKELEDAQKSETEKLQERIAELEPSAKEAARLRVALRKGLNETLAKRLTGDTEEELEADADELLETISNAEDSVVPVTPRQGGDGSTPSRSPEELADAVMKRQRGF